MGNVRLGQTLLFVLCSGLCVLLQVKAAVKMLNEDLLIWMKQPNSWYGQTPSSDAEMMLKCLFSP